MPRLGTFFCKTNFHFSVVRTRRRPQRRHWWSFVKCDHNLGFICHLSNNYVQTDLCCAISNGKCTFSIYAMTSDVKRTITYVD